MALLALGAILKQHSINMTLIVLSGCLPLQEYRYTSFSEKMCVILKANDDNLTCDQIFHQMDSMDPQCMLHPTRCSKDEICPDGVLGAKELEQESDEVVRHLDDCFNVIRRILHLQTVLCLIVLC